MGRERNHRRVVPDWGKGLVGEGERWEMEMDFNQLVDVLGGMHRRPTTTDKVLMGICPPVIVVSGYTVQAEYTRYMA